MKHIQLILALAIGLSGSYLGAQQPSQISFSYAHLADISLSAPVVADVTVITTTRLKGKPAEGTPAGHTRFLVTAAVNALLRGKEGLPPQVSYLADLPLDDRGRAPKIKKSRFLIAARTTPGNAAILQLSRPDSQVPWTPENLDRMRNILTAAVAADAPPSITGVGDAFHVRGTLPGESETQIFLKTGQNRPVSLNVLRRPGETPTWSVALGEMVDEAATAPQRDSLLWYRLACFLPSDLPADATASMNPDDASATAADYKLVIDSLGPCDRGPPAS
jgi:hypothetical protein